VEFLVNLKGEIRLENQLGFYCKLELGSKRKHSLCSKFDFLDSWGSYSTYVCTHNLARYVAVGVNYRTRRVTALDRQVGFANCSSQHVRVGHHQQL
jgi:hypothetical protein